ncbi:MAG: hypothetical protein HOP28_01925 [Gemmatimonadales bacterium]|nr:hypothetical protein [Gemmatimonadales bacterium]
MLLASGSPLDGGLRGVTISGWLPVQMGDFTSSGQMREKAPSSFGPQQYLSSQGSEQADDLSEIGMLTPYFKASKAG